MPQESGEQLPVGERESKAAVPIRPEPQLTEPFQPTLRTLDQQG